jgi:hypothetical protein
MKYIKEFEGLYYKNKNKDSYIALKRGDYIIVKSDDDRIDNEICIVMSDSKKNKLISVEIPEYEGEYIIYPHEVIKKLTKEEVEIYKNQEKYNL